MSLGSKLPGSLLILGRLWHSFRYDWGGRWLSSPCSMNGASPLLSFVRTENWQVDTEVGLLDCMRRGPIVGVLAVPPGLRVE